MLLADGILLIFTHISPYPSGMTKRSSNYLFLSTQNVSFVEAAFVTATPQSPEPNNDFPHEPKKWSIKGTDAGMVRNFGAIETSQSQGTDYF